MYLYIKRAMDIVIAFLALMILSPLFLCLMIAVKVDSPGPVFFTQRRVGRDRRIFKIIKFRTMRIDTPPDVPTHMLEKPEQFITKIGVFLRKFSLDEVPQLINVLKADMYFVAPRPALWNQYDLIAQRDRYVGRYGLTANQISPGMTGWAQINGRDELEIADKARLDGEYMKKLGFIMDCKCFFGTIIRVLKHAGVVEGGTRKLHREEKNTKGENCSVR